LSCFSLIKALAPTAKVIIPNYPTQSRKVWVHFKFSLAGGTTAKAEILKCYRSSKTPIKQGVLAIDGCNDKMKRNLVGLLFYRISVGQIVAGY
jgi:hypothetical protein